MPSGNGGEVTRALARLAAGDEQAAQRLFELAKTELRRLACRAMEHERVGHTLQPTALIHEAWLRLFGGSDVPGQNRQHFLRVAARAMRRVLVDHARARGRAKRDLGSSTPLEAWMVAAEERQLDLCALDLALETLAGADPDLARLVELRFFAGLTIAETAEALGRSTASVERDWRVARALLSRELGES